MTFKKVFLFYLKYIYKKKKNFDYYKFFRNKN